jgi:folylpolyglutamate synthase/dihydropteroate synthase
MGNTIEKIAREKAGIMKPDVPVVSISTQRPEAAEELR